MEPRIKLAHKVLVVKLIQSRIWLWASYISQRERMSTSSDTVHSVQTKKTTQLFNIYIHISSTKTREKIPLWVIVKRFYIMCEQNP